MKNGQGVSDEPTENNQIVVNSSRALSSLATIFPEFIKLRDANKSRGRPSRSATPIVTLDVDNSGSWLCDPTPQTKGDTVGVWPVSTNFPIPNKNFVPIVPSLNIDMSHELPNNIPMEFVDGDIERFLNGGNLTTNSKIRLNPQVFEPCDFTVDKKTNFNLLDSLSRKCISENAIVDQFIGSTRDRIHCILENWEAQTDRDAIREEFMILFESLDIAYATNLRCKQFIISFFTSNKLSFRKYVLDRCVGNDLTKETMKGTGLATPSLFGNIPESFAKRLDASSASNAQNYMLKPFVNNSSVQNDNNARYISSNVKRQLPSSSIPPAKRYKSSFTSPSQPSTSGYKVNFNNNNNFGYNKNFPSRSFEPRAQKGFQTKQPFRRNQFYKSNGKK